MMAQVTDQDILTLNITLQLKVNALTKENSEIQFKLDGVSNKLSNYEGLTKDLADMRGHLDKATTTILKMRDENNQLRLRNNIVTEECEKKVKFLQAKIDLLTARKSCATKDETVLVDLTNSLVSSDAENMDSSSNATTLSIQTKVESRNCMKIFGQKPLGRVENRLLSRVRQCHQRKSISTEELSTSGNPKKAVLNAHLRMRGIKTPNNEVFAPKQLGGSQSTRKVVPASTLSRTNSCQSREVIRKPFRC